MNGFSLEDYDDDTNKCGCDTTLKINDGALRCVLVRFVHNCTEC